jgi:hypothetical protein
VDEIEAVADSVSAAIAALDASDGDGPAARQLAETALRQLGVKGGRLREQAEEESDAGGGRSGALYLGAVQLAELCEALAPRLRARGLLREERSACSMRAALVTRVQGHYPHLVGPAMLAEADCLERLGERDEARQRYAAVTRDFAWLVDEYADDETLHAESRTELESLLRAIERYQALGGPPLEGLDAAALAARTQAMLARPTAADSD